MSTDWTRLTSLEKMGELPLAEEVPPSSYAAEKVLFISDIHIPFEDKLVVEQLFLFLRDNRFDRIVINGDLVDFYDISRFVSRKEVPIEDEVKQTRLFLDRLRSLHDGPIDFTVGNHELRLELYLRTDANKLRGLEVLELPNLLGFKDYHINNHGEEGFMLRPHFLVYHGTVVRKHSGWSAKGELEKHGISGISGHTHRLESYHVTDRQGTRSWMEQGCLCSCDAEYITGVPNWQQGFAIGEFAYDSKWFHVQRIPILDRKLMINGTDYSSLVLGHQPALP